MTHLERCMTTLRFFLSVQEGLEDSKTQAPSLTDRKLLHGVVEGENRQRRAALEAKHLKRWKFLPSDSPFSRSTESANQSSAIVRSQPAAADVTA